MLKPEDLVGQLIDEKYRIELQLGQGGMGAVYLAEHVGTERLVAVKVIVPQYMNNNEFVERFKLEARAAGKLRHPNIVNVTDFGFTEVAGNRIAYLVMEYLNGCNLGDMLEERKRMQLDFVVDIVQQICLAVEAAHQKGIVHRDLKPDNIWLEPNGRGGYNVKVLDFGLAKLRDSQTGMEMDNALPAAPRRAVNSPAPNAAVDLEAPTGIMTVDPEAQTGVMSATTDSNLPSRDDSDEGETAVMMEGNTAANRSPETAGTTSPNLTR